MGQNQPVTTPVQRWASRVLGWLIEPSSALTDPDWRRRASLLSALLLVLIAFGIAGMTNYMVDAEDPLSVAYSIESLLMSLILLAIYGISRTRHYELAAAATVLTVLIAIFVMIYPNTDPSTLYWFTYLVIPVLICSLFLTIRATIVSAAAAVAGMIIYGLALSPVALQTDIPLTFVTLISALIIGAAHYRNVLETDRREVLRRTLELQAANERLVELDKLKDQFVANVSHELRSPITSLKLQEDMLARSPKNFDKHMGAIKRETERLETLIEDVLRLSRFDQRRVELRASEVDLRMIAKPLVEDRGVVAARREISVTISGDDQPRIAVADPGMVTQVLSILLTNAINYIQNGASIRVALETEAAGPRTGFRVIDNGPGITADDLSHIFERFYRGKAGRDSDAAGTGLGLSIAKEMVERQGGSISVTSDGVAGKGTEFTVWLPAASLKP